MMVNWGVKGAMLIYKPVTTWEIECITQLHMATVEQKNTVNPFIYISLLWETIWGSFQGGFQCLVSAGGWRVPASPAGGYGGWWWELVMSDVISIFLTISNACAKTRHYCCNALTRDHPAIRQHFGKTHSNTLFLLFELHCLQLGESNGRNVIWAVEKCCA